MGTTTTKGEIGEAMVLADLRRRGYGVAIPFEDAQSGELSAAIGCMGFGFSCYTETKTLRALIAHPHRPRSAVRPDPGPPHRGAGTGSVQVHRVGRTGGDGSLPIELRLSPVRLHERARRLAGRIRRHDRPVLLPPFERRQWSRPPPFASWPRVTVNAGASGGRWTTFRLTWRKGTGRIGWNPAPRYHFALRRSSSGVEQPPRKR